MSQSLISKGICESKFKFEVLIDCLNSAFEAFKTFLQNVDILFLVKCMVFQRREGSRNMEEIP